MSQVFVSGHKSPDTDSIAAALSYSYLKRRLGMDAVAVRAGEINKESRFALDYFNLEEPILVTSVERKNPEDEKQKVILVDHNESKQTIDGMDDAEVLEIIDHHRFGDFESENPIFILVRPVGCVNTVIYGLYKTNHIKPSREIAGIMLSAIISDTVLFRSPTTTEEDKETAKELAEIAAGNVFTVGQISVMNVDPINEKKAEIMKVLEAIKAEKGYAASYLMVTDILAEDTFLWFTEGAESIVEKAFAGKPENGVAYLPHVMSRKKQVTPPLLKAYGE